MESAYNPLLESIHHSSNIYIINPNSTDQQIRIGRYDGTNYGIAFTTDGGATWQNAIGFDGVHFSVQEIIESEEFAEAVDNIVGTSDAINNVYSYVDTTLTDFKQTASDITALVENTTVTKTEYDSFAQTIRNLLAMGADGTTMIFEEISQSIANVEGIETEHWNELQTYIRLSIEGIELGKKGNAITMKLENDNLAFYNNSVRVAYIRDNKLYITDGEFLRYLIIGNYTFVIEDDQSLSLIYSGGA